MIVDRAVLEQHGLRYDTGFGESEDFDLWARLLEHADGDNVLRGARALPQAPGPGVGAPRGTPARLPAAVALRQIDGARSAARRPSGRPRMARGPRSVASGDRADAADALATVVAAFEARLGGREARRAAAWALARGGTPAGGRCARAGCPLDPTRSRGRDARRAARAEPSASVRWLAGRRRAGPCPADDGLPEVAPYRTPMLDRLAERPEVDLTVLYAARAVQTALGDDEPRHRAVVLEGRACPGSTGRSATTTRLAGCLPRAPGRTPGGRRRLGLEHLRLAGRRLVVPQSTACPTSCSSRATSGRPARLAPRPSRAPSSLGSWAARRRSSSSGRSAREAMLARGVAPERISVFADTIDVEAFGAACDRLAGAA